MTRKETIILKIALVALIGFLCSGSVLATTASLGCYSDSDSPNRILTFNPYTSYTSAIDNSLATVEICSFLCFVYYGYIYAGVEAGNGCFCDYRLNNNNGNNNAISSSSCGSNCPGNSGEKCGGSWAINVYSQNNFAKSSFYKGCYTDTSESQQGSIKVGTSLMGAPTSTNRIYTPATCVAYCSSHGYTYAGLQGGGYCYCSNSLNGDTSGSLLTTSNNCDYGCAVTNVATYLEHGSTGDQTCGGFGDGICVICNEYLLGCSSDCPCDDGDCSIHYKHDYAMQVYQVYTPTIPMVYKGCYKDGNGAGNGDGNPRILSKLLFGQSPLITVENCVSACFQAGYIYAGLEAGDECWCGNSLISDSLGSRLNNAENCNQGCTGNGIETCGGGWAMQVYGPYNSYSQGCYNNGNGQSGVGDGGSPLLGTMLYTQSGINSVERCTSLCYQAGYTYAGVQHGEECWCGNTLNGDTNGSRTGGSCNVACEVNPGGTAVNPSGKCGGSWAMQIFHQPSIPTTVSSYKSYGCYHDGSGAGIGTNNGDGLPRLLSNQIFKNNSDSVEYCTTQCTAQGYTYAGVEVGNECWCGNTLNNDISGSRKTNSCNGTSTGACQCTKPCNGDSRPTSYAFWTPIQEKCGGPWAMSVYSSTTMPTPHYLAGCYHDGNGQGTGTNNGDGQSRILNTLLAKDDPANTVEKCTSACYNNGFLFAGMEAGDECWCGNTLNGDNFASRLSTSCNATSTHDQCACTQPCNGNSSQTCGGQWAMSVYTNALYGWLGCYNDGAGAGNGDGNPRILSKRVYMENGANRPELCINTCFMNGYIYAGLEAGEECWCGNWLNGDNQGSRFLGSDLASNGCGTVCPGTPAGSGNLCGGSWKIAILFSLSYPSNWFVN